MAAMFYDADFDADLSGWNVAAVTDMRMMFGYTSAFNADLSGWDVGAVQDMTEMFTHNNLSGCNRHRIEVRWGENLISSNYLYAPAGPCTDYCSAGLCGVNPDCAAGFYAAACPPGQLCSACPAEHSCAGGGAQPVRVSGS